MLSAQFIIEIVVNLLRTFLFSSSKAAAYAKYFLRIRDYLLLLFPLEMYPEGQTNDPVLAAGIDVQPVTEDDIKKATRDYGFNLPFIRGM